MEERNITLTVIGGGSIMWMSRLMKDIYQLASVQGGEIRLVDPMVKHAKAVGRMLRKFNEATGKTFEINATTDRKTALTGADVVICTFSPGRMEAFENDLELPIRYGIRQPVSMTVGPCGHSAALRTCPVAFDIVTEMETLCPGAILLNVTNPMTAVTRATNLAARTVKVIGMCHEFHHLPHCIGDAVGLSKPEKMPVLDYLYSYLPEQGLDYDIAGINHFIWVTRADLNGKDMLPTIRDYARKRLSETGIPGREDITAARRDFAKFTLCDVFGYMPVPGDRHLVEFLPSLCNQRTGWGMEYGARKTVVQGRVRSKEHGLRDIEEIADGQREIEWRKSNEEMTVILDALLTGKQTVGIMNLPNRGQISNLPEERVVETLADVQKNGAIVPRPAGELPRPIATLCRLQTDIIEMVVEASLKGDRNLFVQALALDPLSADASLREIGALADELLYANRLWLERFYEEGDAGYVGEAERQ